MMYSLFLHFKNLSMFCFINLHFVNIGTASLFTDIVMLWSIFNVFFSEI